MCLSKKKNFFIGYGVPLKPFGTWFQRIPKPVMRAVLRGGKYELCVLASQCYGVITFQVVNVNLNFPLLAGIME